MIKNNKLAEICIPSQAEQLKIVRDKVHMIAEQQGCLQEDIKCMVLAVNEACMNIMQHGYGPDICGNIVLEILRDNDHLIFHLIDFAKPVDECAVKSRPLDEIRPGGLGVHLINEVMDEVRYIDCNDRTGNILEMKKKIKKKVHES